MTDARIRFKVPETELLHLKSFLGTQGFSMRTWVDVMLTYLCCPGCDHPAVAQKGVTTPALLTMAQLRAPDPTDTPVYYDFRWPASLIPLIDPGLAAAELNVSSILASLWQWTHAPALTLNVNVAVHLAAFATGFTPTPRNWVDIRADYKQLDPLVSPHQLVQLPTYQCEVLPWVVRVKGVRKP